MIKVCYQELKRFKFIFLFTFSVIFIYTFLSGPVRDINTYTQMDFVIKILTILSMTVILVYIIMDSYNQNQTMYQKTSVDQANVFYGKWLSTIILGSMTLLFGMILMNIKVSLYFFSDSLSFLTSDISSLPLIIFGKKWFELLYIPNYLTNLAIYSFIVIYINLRIKDIIQYGNPYDFYYTIPWVTFKILALHVVFRFFIVFIEPHSNFLNFNSTGYYQILGNQNDYLFMNFLFIPSIILYTVYFYVTKIKINELLSKQ